MRTLVAGAAAAALLAVATPGAHAASDSVYSGSCQLNAQNDPSGQNTWIGVLSGVVFVYSVNTPGDNPVSADLTCEVRVDGTTVDSHTEPGTGFVWQASQALFVADSTATVEVCTIVDYTSNTTPTASACVPWP